MNKAVKIIDSLIDLPIRKVELIASERGYVIGLWNTLSRYGLHHTPELLQTMKDCIETKIVGCNDIEAEWTERQYKALVQFNPFELNS